MLLKFWLTLCSLCLANSAVVAKDTLELEDKVQGYVSSVKTIVEAIKDQKKEMESKPKKVGYELYQPDVKNNSTIPEIKSNKTEPGAQMFAQAFENQGAECKISLNILDSFYPELKECYTTTALYFSTLENVCSSKCLDITVKTSKLVSKYCLEPIKDELKKNTTVYNSKYTAYNSWSNKNLSDISCLSVDKQNKVEENKPYNEEGKEENKKENKEEGKKEIKTRCLDVLEKGSNMISNLNATNPNDFIPKDEGKKKELKELICHSCIEKYNEVLTSNANITVNDIPTIYLISLEGKDVIFKTYDTLCRNQTKY